MNNFDVFGVMIDCSRNAVMKPEAIRKFVDLISKMGYNMLQLYTEDTYTIEDEPYFGYLRGRYTHSELKEIDQFCIEKGVELVPCVQTLAHFNAIARWKQFDDIIDCNDILLVEEEKTYIFIEKIFKTLSECFTSRKVNIGMDEATMVGLGKYLNKHGFQNRFEILLNHLNRVCKIALKYGFKPMMWSDMFFRLANNGEYSANNLEKLQDFVNLVPKEVELIYWDYYSDDKAHYDKMIDGHKCFNNEIIFAGACWSWRGFFPQNSFSIKASKAALESCKQKGIKKVMLTMWGDNGGECSFFSLLPSLMYNACIAKGITDTNQIKDMFKKLTNVDFDDMMLLDSPNQPGKHEVTVQNPGKYMFYSDVFLGIFDCNVNEDDKLSFIESIKKLQQVDGRGDFGYLFNLAKIHCEILSVKYDLGLRIRKLYRKNDREALNKITEYDFVYLLEKLEEFYESLKKRWNTENKPYGFDVQDQRIGGLIMRLKSCKKRLQEYVSGEIDIIEELEEEILPYYSDDLVGKPLIFNSWTQNVTVNII